MTKLTFMCPDSTVETWKRMADERGQSMTETLNQIILGQAFVRQEVDAGNKLLIECRCGMSCRQVIFA
jgi:hypothetical protein